MPVEISPAEICTPAQWEDITTYTCNTGCTCEINSTCYDADDLKEACEICTGNVWDPITSRCCGDDGVSDTWCNNGNGACVNGVWHPDHCSDGILDCDELGIDCSDEGGDCCKCDSVSCSISDECCSGSCTSGICGSLKDIKIVFADNGSDYMILPIGTNTILTLKVKNNLPVKDTIRLQLIGSPDQRIVYWSKFSNNEKIIDITLDGNEEITVPITVFAGQIGIYELRVFAESLSFQSLIAHEAQRIYIRYEQSGLSSRSPGIGWFSLILVILIVSLLMNNKH